MKKQLLLLNSLVFLTSISAQAANSNFGTDKTFLQKNTDAVVLSDSSGKAEVIVIPQYQGRVMTSTADGNNGLSFGWINYQLIDSKKLVPHINTFGGEDRFWMGPEGGQFGLYFSPKTTFIFDNWQVPAPFDTEKYSIATKTKNSVTLTKKLLLKNYTGTEFDVKVTRTVNLLTPTKTEQILGLKIPFGVKTIGYESNNKVTNIGKNTWDKQNGLLSIWILGNYTPSPATRVILPINKGNESKLGKKVNIYQSFGEIPKDRLTEKDNVIIFKADGNKRAKIGLSPARAKDILGSYDAANNVLTIVKYNKPENITDYVNSTWEIQKQPYAGDVVNSYNDGPIAEGQKPLGPFYELETSSPALALAPNQSYTHVRYTFHFVGPQKDLDLLAKNLLGVSLSELGS